MVRCKKSSKRTKCKVVIIGAGIAGLMAAVELIKAGILDFYILESEDRIGGRIYSVKSGHHYIEYGAQWLHAEENELKNISVEYDLLSDVESVEGEGKFYSNIGIEYNNNVINEISNVVSDILHQCEQFKDKPGIHFSVGEFLLKKFDEYVYKNVHSKDDIQIWYNVLKWHMKFHEIDNSCESLFELSAKCWGHYDFNGEDSQRHINYKRGYISLLNKIMKKIPYCTIQLNTKVDKIDWNRNDHKVVIHTRYNKYICDHVIVTVSLGVLKDNIDTLFFPKLPYIYECAITHLGFSGFGKIFLQFSERWWGDIKGFQFIWTPEHKKLTNKLKKKKALWVKYISGFDVVSVGPPNCLIAWITAAGTKIMEKLSESKIKKDCIYLLKTFLNLEKLPRIHLAKRTSWMSNPSFSGCYSHITIASDMYNVGPSTLAQPIINENKKPIMLFAGEATHEKYFSTTHGAAESGIRQAKVITEYCKNQRH